MVDQIDTMDIIAYYLSEYDSKAFQTLGFSTQTAGFDAVAALFGRKASYLRRLRDEYDVVTSSHRNGQRNRPPRDRIKRTQKYFSKFSFGEMTEIVSAFLTNKTKDLNAPEDNSTEYAITEMSESEIENVLNFHDSAACLKIKEGSSSVRVYNTSIIKQLKKIYGGRCQICNKKIFEEFGTDICEAHHIEHFSLTQNNDSSNIIILCPNHHRLMHKMNPRYILEEKCFEFKNNQRLYVGLDFHLAR